MSFVATPTMWECMNSDAYVRVINGAVGSGKSVMCCHELVKMAMQQAPNADGIRKSRSLIVRNTADQLRTTTMKTFFDWFPPGQWGRFKVSERAMTMSHRLQDGTRMEAEFWFAPLDSPDDVRRVLSLELTFLWGNEWRELAPEVVDGLLMRLRRYPSKKDGGPSRSCALFDTNSPDADSWHFDKMENPPENWEIFHQPPAVLSRKEWIDKYGEEPDGDGVFDRPAAAGGTEWFVNPDADNIDNLDAHYYPDIIPGKSEDFINVYLRGKYGRSLSGLPVYEKTFSEEFHVAKKAYTAVRAESYPLVIGLDFGRTPAAAFMQMNTSGQVVLLSEVVSKNMGLEKFLDTRLRPHVAKHYAGYPLLVAPDPAGFFKQQLGEESPVDVLRKAGFRVVKPHSNKIEPRLAAVERLLLRHIDGKAGFLINPGCETALKGFRYGYRYKLKKNGSQETTPDKNEYSHLADAIQYGAMVIDTAGSGQALNARREVVQVNAAGWT